jgi:Ca-activated chloride channel homolog
VCHFDSKLDEKVTGCSSFNKNLQTDFHRIKNDVCTFAKIIVLQSSDILRIMKKRAFILMEHPNTVGRGIFFNLVALFIFISGLNKSVSAQTAHKLLRQADRNYGNTDYKQAEENYTKAQQAQRSSQGDYNLANTIYKQQRYDEAAKQYEDIAAKTQDKKLKFNSLYNKGNAHFAKKEYDKSVESYKNALRMNPNDSDAKKNLALAQRMLQQQQQQQDRDKKNQDKNKDNQDKNQQNKDPKDPKDQNQQNKDPKNQNPNQQNQQQQNQQQQNQSQQQQELKKDQARQILQIMDDEERKVQQRMRKGKPKPSRSTKDW